MNHEHEAPSRPRVLVTGAAGNIARRIADGLSDDFDLILTDTPQIAAKHANMIPADLLDVESVERLMTGVDMVVHMAIASSRVYKGTLREAFDDEQMRVNVIGTQHVFAAANQVGVGRFVFASSMTIDIGTPMQWPIPRDSPPRPKNLYACTKLFGEQLGEQYARQFGMSVVCLRFGQPFPLDWSSDLTQLASPRSRGMFVAFADIEQSVRCALVCKGIRYKVVRIVSASDEPVVDLTAAAEIGYRPCRRFTETGEEPVEGTHPKPRPRGSDNAGDEFRIAAIATTWFATSHADVILSRWLEPRPGDADWGWPRRRPRSRIVSVYMDQIGKDDIGREILDRHKVPLFDTVEEALVRDDELCADAVLLIGEHGDYPQNDLGQYLYPRKELFDQIVKAFHRTGRTVPVFCDKHLSWNFEWASAMMQSAFEMGFLLFGGSSIPHARLSAPIRLARGSMKKEKEVVAVFFCDDEAYGFHSIELVQQIIEGQRQSETGVQNVTVWRGDDVWRELDAGTWSRDLMDSAIAAADAAAADPPLADRNPDVRTNCSASGEAGPTAFQMLYDDGLRVTHINLAGHITNWGVATFLEDGTISATATVVGGADSYYGHFATLCRVIEDTFLSGFPQFPPSRTLLTTGQIAAVMKARAQPGQLLFTPELLMEYKPINHRHSSP